MRSLPCVSRSLPAPFLTTMAANDNVPRIVEPKGRDFATHRESPALPAHHITSNSQDIISVSDFSDTATNSSDEFDWDEEDGQNGSKHIKTKAARGRKVWLLFLKLARPIRVILVGILGAGLLIAPLLVFQFRFLTSPARDHVHVWSLWLSIAWAAGCLTYIVVDLIPATTIRVIRLFGGHVERRKTQIEVRTVFSALPCCIYLFIAHLCCPRMDQTFTGHSLGMDHTLCHSLNSRPPWIILGYCQSGHAGKLIQLSHYSIINYTFRLCLQLPSSPLPKSYSSAMWPLISIGRLSQTVFWKTNKACGPWTGFPMPSPHRRRDETRIEKDTNPLGARMYSARLCLATKKMALGGVHQPTSKKRAADTKEKMPRKRKRNARRPVPGCSWIR